MTESTHRQPPSTDFSFHIAKQQRQSWRAHLPPPTPELERREQALATSTPIAEIAKREHTSSKAPKLSISPSLAIFKFHHDTHTRRHLEALVKEIDALASPPSSVSLKPNRLDDIAWLESLTGLQAPNAMNADVGFDGEGRLSNTRSAKRVRLSLSELRSSHSERSEPLMTRSTATPHTERRLQRLAQSARKSTTSSPRYSTPSRPPLRSLPPMSMPVRRTLASAMISPALVLARTMPTSRSDPHSGNADILEPNQQTKTPAHKVKDKLAEARILMEKIKTRHVGKDQQQPEFSTNGSNLNNGVGKGHPSDSRSMIRPANPTPMTATLGHAVGNAPLAATERLELQGEKETTTCRADLSTPEDERQDALAPLPIILAPNAGALSIRRALSEPQQILTFSAPSSINSSIGRRMLLPAPLGPQRPLARPASSFSSQTSSDRFFTSTSTRIPSNSTVATSVNASINNDKRKVMASSASSGPILVTPGEVANIFTREVLGDMVFDATHQRWLKISDIDRNDGRHLSRISEQQSPEAKDYSEDDPFRDITSFESSKSEEMQSGEVRHRRSGSLTFAVREERSIAKTEKTSTPPVAVTTIPPLVSPDLPSIQSAQPPQPPRSALKSRIESFTTPIPGNRTLSDEKSKLSRSVSFSDGRDSGRILNVKAAQLPRESTKASALRNELEVLENCCGDSAAEDDFEDNEASDDTLNPLNPNSNHLAPVTSTVGRYQVEQLAGERNTVKMLYELDKSGKRMQRDKFDLLNLSWKNCNHSRSSRDIQLAKHTNCVSACKWTFTFDSNSFRLRFCVYIGFYTSLASKAAECQCHHSNGMLLRCFAR